MTNQRARFDGRLFHNPIPTEVMDKGAFLRVMRQWFRKHPFREPVEPLGPFDADMDAFKRLEPDQLRVTWLGHSTLILEINGKRLLTDPVWYQRASPFKYLGPKRFFDVPIALNDLPPIDYILLSHDHYDHLDKATILNLANRNIPVITMLGVGQRLIKWGVRKELVTESDWWQQTELPGGLVITAAPARHFSGRGLNDRFTTLWGSFAIKGKHHNVYYGADSGYFDGFAGIGEKLGPFDLALLEVGAYYKEWESIHMGPEMAVQAHADIKGGVLMPIHWGTFSLAFHPWTEPAQRVIKEAKNRDTPLLMPAPGETVSVHADGYINRWER